MTEKKVRKTRKPKADKVNSITEGGVTVVYPKGVDRGRVAQQLDRIKDQIMSR